ncbi:MAG: bifunctional DNA primase/polymerase [Syntrophaceae bacterium]|nr:bifunctional DNA primase/polymerase [Syntrophaceae bacterium]
MGTVEIALSYLKRGYSVMPVWSPDMVKRRQPATFRKRLAEAKAKNAASDNPLPEQNIVRKELIKQCKEPVLAWKEYQNRLPTEEEVTQWFTNDPDANIGIITGKVSNLSSCSTWTPKVQASTQRSRGDSRSPSWPRRGKVIMPT